MNKPENQEQVVPKPRVCRILHLTLPEPVSAARTRIYTLHAHLPMESLREDRSEIEGEPG